MKIRCLDRWILRGKSPSSRSLSLPGLVQGGPNEENLDISESYFFMTPSHRTFGRPMARTKRRAIASSSPVDAAEALGFHDNMQPPRIKVKEARRRCHSNLFARVEKSLESAMAGVEVMTNN